MFRKWQPVFLAELVFDEFGRCRNKIGASFESFEQVYEVSLGTAKQCPAKIDLTIMFFSFILC